MTYHNRRGAALVAIAALAVTATLAGCKTGGDVMGSNYVVTHYRGLDGVPGSHEVEWGPKQFDQLQQLDRSCHQDLDPAMPGMAKPMLREAALVGLGDGIGVATGATLGFGSLVKWQQYFGYGAGAGVGTGLAYGFDREVAARRYAKAACMYLQTNWAQILDGQLQGVGVVPWTGGTSARPTPRPSGTVGAPYFHHGASNPAAPPPPPPQGS